MKTDLPDGLYQVVRRRFCAGFIVIDGWVEPKNCAPILRRRLGYWVTYARKIN